MSKTTRNIIALLIMLADVWVGLYFFHIFYAKEQWWFAIPTMFTGLMFFIIAIGITCPESDNDEGQE